jgi:uncharacterized protein YccT (UPF0319 family)
MITSFFVPKKTREPCEDMTNRTEDKRARETPSSQIEKGKKQKLSEVDDLLSHLHDDGEMSWRTALERYTASQSFASLAKFLAAERLVCWVHSAWTSND